MLGHECRMRRFKADSEARLYLRKTYFSRIYFQAKVYFKTKALACLRVVFLRIKSLKSYLQAFDLKAFIGVMIMAALPAGSALAQVIPDGTTATTVNIDAATGRANVEIAPSFDSRISHNRFTEFNVDGVGLNLDNRLVNARTIVNEVSGSNPSLIQGEIEVLGQRAHVILANRNGITVDGGRFINTGGVALSTGAVEFIERQVAPNIFQNNTVLRTGQGFINIEAGGLTGMMDRLDLLSRELRIAGLVTNENDDPLSQIGVYTGVSVAEYDSAIVPTNTASQWGRVTAGDGSGRALAPAPIVIDVTRTGGLSASRIFIEVTDLGAGVRYAGDGLATRRDFTLDADGALIFSGAEITAATDVNITAAGINAASRPFISDDDPARRSIFSAAFGATNLTALSDDITLNDTRITGFSGFAPNGANQDVNQGANQGAVNLIAQNGNIRLGSSSAALRSDIISFAREGIEVADDIVLSASGTIDIGDAVISSADDIIARAQSIGISGIIARTVFAAEGGIDLEASQGDIVNQGGLLQALGTNQGASSLAGLRLDAAGNVINQTLDADHLGILFSEQDIIIGSGDQIINDTARISSNGAITLNAAAGIEAFIAYGDGLGSDGNGNDNRDFSQVLADQIATGGKNQSLDFGDLAVGGVLSLISAGTDLTLIAPELYNRGADFSANNGDLTITAQNVELEAVYSGSYNFRRRCFIFCSSSGSSTVNAVGGRLSASNDININGADSLVLNGGDAIAFGDINVQAAQISLVSATLPSVIGRPSGLYNLWAGRSAFLIWQDSQGTLTAGGQLTIDSDEAIALSGGQLSAQNIVNPAGSRLVRMPNDINPLVSDRLGILRIGQ